ncbi:MAG: hypothetical protein OXR67_15190 [Chloroflexota bacterium]|nr:hypothetical protein [Chloroflexota bacterium]
MTTDLSVPASRSPRVPAPVDRQRLQEAMASARSPSTRRCYSSQWNLWSRWAEARGHQVMPAEPLAVADYLLDRAESGASIATVKMARSALAAIHKDAGHPDPTDNEGVRRVLAGLSRTISRPQQQAAALTREVQVAIQATASFPRMLPSGQMETHARAQARALVDIALVAVMRDALLRRSEAASLFWRDLKPAADGSGRLTVQSSKTDQSGEGSVLYLSPTTMDALLQVRPAAASSEKNIFGLSPRQINRRIAAAAKAAGVQGDFAGHSPRVGMAIDLAASGCELPGGGKAFWTLVLISFAALAVAAIVWGLYLCWCGRQAEVTDNEGVKVSINPQILFDPAFLVFLLILCGPVVLSAVTGLAFAWFVGSISKKRAMLVGVCMGIAVVGAGFGFYSGLLQVMDFIYPSKVTIGNTTTFSTYHYQMYMDDIMFGTYWIAMALSPALTGLACFIGKVSLSEPRP